MEFYSGKQPNLIGPIMKDTMDKIINNTNPNPTISDKVNNLVSGFYNDYIAPHLILIIIIIIIAGWLIYRYFNKKHKSEQYENQSIQFDDTEKINTNLLQELEKYANKNMENETIRMNPMLTPEDNGVEMNYVADEIPLRFVPGQNLIQPPKPYVQPDPRFNTIPYDPSRFADTRLVTAGTVDTYAGVKDTDMVSPYGWDTNFNKTSGSYVSGMVDLNNQALSDLDMIRDTNQQNMESNKTYIPQFIPPYSA